MNTQHIERCVDAIKSSDPVQQASGLHSLREIFKASQPRTWSRTSREVQKYECIPRLFEILRTRDHEGACDAMWCLAELVACTPDSLGVFDELGAVQCCMDWIRVCSDRLDGTISSMMDATLWLTGNVCAESNEFRDAFLGKNLAYYVGLIFYRALGTPHWLQECLVAIQSHCLWISCLLLDAHHDAAGLIALQELFRAVPFGLEYPKTALCTDACWIVGHVAQTMNSEAIMTLLDRVEPERIVNTLRCAGGPDATLKVENLITLLQSVRNIFRTPLCPAMQSFIACDIGTVLALISVQYADYKRVKRYIDKIYALTNAHSTISDRMTLQATVN